jgi:hypothetical protein
VISCLGLSKSGDEGKEIDSVRQALAVYFNEHNRYPENLESLIGKAGLEKRTVERFSYFPEYDYGTFSWEYHGRNRIVFLLPPPLSEQTHHAKVMHIRAGLRNYYMDHGRFPKTLSEYAQEIGRGLLDEVNTGEYAYSVGEDFQSFTLDGQHFGPPPPPGIVGEERETKILGLKAMLHSFYLRRGRYPTDLQELEDSGIMFSHYVSEFLEGENITYEVSDDGQRSYLDGVELEPVPPIQAEEKEEGSGLHIDR